jgi:hypothetical protein
VPVADLFAEMGNTVVPGRGGTLECGHEPRHSSSSGRCVLIWPAEGRWYCRSCGQSGDAATLVMHQKGVGYRQAAADLTLRFGPPQESPPVARRDR